MDRTTDDILADAEALVTKANLRLEKELQELECKKQMVANLPLGLPLPLKSLHGFGYHCVGQLVFEMTDRTQLESLLEKLPPVETIFLQQKGGCSTFLPLASFDGILKEKQTSTPVYGVKFDVNGYGPGHINEEFNWWTQLGDQLVKISLKMKSGTASSSHLVANHDPDSKSRQFVSWIFSGLPDGTPVYWGHFSAPVPGSITVYWPDHLSMLKGVLVRRSLSRKSN